MAFNNACFHSFLNSSVKSNGRAVQRGNSVMLEAIASHEIGSEATAFQSHSLSSSSRFSIGTGSRST